MALTSALLGTILRLHPQGVCGSATGGETEMKAPFMVLLLTMALVCVAIPAVAYSELSLHMDNAMQGVQRAEPNANVQILASEVLGLAGVVLSGQQVMKGVLKKAKHTQAESTQEKGSAMRTQGEPSITYPGEWLKALREAKGYTRKQLAQACSVSEATISLIESGKRNPGPQLAVRLGRVLGEKGDKIFLRSHLAKAPELTGGQISNSDGIQNGDDENGGEDEDDPRLIELQMRLQDMQAILAESDFSVLLESLKGTVQAYERMKGKTSI
jgi:transcriptional regulator with XRE-family HTH domain